MQVTIKEDPIQEVLEQKMMDTMFEIVPPEGLVVKMELAKSVPVELVLERQVYRDEHSHRLVEEFVAAPDISIPVKIDQDTLPFSLLTRVEKSSQLPNKASMSIRVIQKRNIRIKLKNLEFLKNVFGEDATMKLILSHDGALKNWQTEELEIRECETNAEASVWISEDIDELLIQHGRRKRYRTAHGEVSSLTGNITIHATWTVKPRPKLMELSTKFERHQSFIMARSFDHQVDLVARNGKIMKVSKALLAAFSEKIEKQLQFLLDDNMDARLFKAIKIFSGTQTDGEEDCLDEDGLRALVKFITMNSISEPLSKPVLALELMITASYNMVTDLEKAMALILLTQPVELFDLDTSAHLYWFSSLKVEMHRRGEESKRKFWDRLKVRALWNMKWVSKEDLANCEAIQKLFPDNVCLENFLSLL